MTDKWDKRFLSLAHVIGTWSKDPSTGVGAVIVDDNHRVLSLGFNGFPSGIKDTKERLQHREIKLMITIHAEENAILFAPTPFLGPTTMYVSKPPCAKCASKIIQVGIRRVVTAVEAGGEFSDRWHAEFSLAKQLFMEADVELCQI